jgi:uncharacterized protein YdaU (DUF1376 family)
MSSFYMRYTGDYSRDTAHLTLIEHGAYCVLLDAYYASEEPLPADKARLYRMARAFDEQEQDAVDAVLERFFTKRGNSYHNKRADAEIGKIKDKTAKARAAAEKRWSEDKQDQAVHTRAAPADWNIDITENSTILDVVGNLCRAFPRTSEQAWASILAPYPNMRQTACIVRDWLVDIANSTEDIKSPTKYLRYHLLNVSKRKAKEAVNASEITDDI